MNTAMTIRAFLQGGLLVVCVPALAASATRPTAGAVAPPSAALAKRAGPTHSAQTMPAALRPAFYRALAKDAAPAYRLNEHGCATLARSRLTGCFTRHGARFSAGSTPLLALHLAAWRRGEALHPAGSVTPVMKDNRVSYAHGIVTAWWRVLPMGFEQGFTIAKRPAGHGQLVLALSSRYRHSRAGGNPAAFVGRDKRSVPGKHMSNSGAPDQGGFHWGRLRYGKLVVTDARGKVVPATLTRRGDRVLITVNDTQAAYPLTVDPLVWLEQKVTVSDGAAGGQFGYSVALAGSTALIGADSATVNGNLEQGAAYVFSDSDGSWRQVQKLTASDGAEGDNFGTSVALAGTTALIGASNATMSAVYVFTESGGAWGQSQKLTASDGMPDDEFGSSVALAGATALIGAPGVTVNGNPSQGAAYVFTDVGGSWSQAQKLAASDGAAGDSFGTSVALDGATALVGAQDYGNGGPGAAYVFSDSGGSWTQTQKLTASDSEAGASFGNSAALAGTTALIGAPGVTVNGNPSQGAAYVFTDVGGSWSQTQKLTASDGTKYRGFGSTLAVSGATAIIGNGHNNSSAYIFTDSNGVWSQTQVLALCGQAGNYFNNDYVAFSGATVLCGAASGGSSTGVAYFYDKSSLDLVVSAPQTVKRQQTYLSQVIATNSASAASPAVSATIAVPAAASFMSATATQGSCGQASGIVTCDFGQINGNAGTASADVTLKATGNIGTAIRNTASVAKATPPLTAGATTSIADNPPIAQDGSLTTNENEAANGTLVATDSDLGQTLTYSIVTKPRHGKVKLNDASKGTYTYTPNQGYSGSDSFTFKANDGIADSNTATISITVKAIAPPPPPPPPHHNGGGGGGFGLMTLGFFALLVFGVYRRRWRVS